MKIIRYSLIAFYFLVFLYVTFGIRIFPVYSIFTHSYYFAQNRATFGQYNLDIWHRYSEIEGLGDLKTVFLNIDFWGNILMFIPFPYCIHHLFGVRRWWKLLLAGIFTSIIVELLQLLFKLGIADINDVLTNTLGTAAGIVFFYGWNNMVKKSTKK